MYKEYWTISSNWPRPTRSHIPMAQAVLEIGATTIPGWTGREVQDERDLLPGLPPFISANRDNRCRAHGHLMAAKVEGYTARPNFTKMPSYFTSGEIRRSPDIPDYILSEAEYETALQIIQERNEPLRMGAMRLYAARSEFIRAATMGEFETVARAVNGFETQPLNPDVWSVVRVGVVLTACTIDPKKPDAIYLGSNPVMVDRPSFASWLETQRGERKVAAGQSTIPEQALTVSAAPNAIQSPPAQPLAAAQSDAKALTRPMFNLYNALCEIYGDSYGGYGIAEPKDRFAAFSAWRNRLKPPKPPEKRLSFPGDIGTAIRRLDKDVFIPAKTVILKGK